jgi:FkbM family methyltransferase
MITASRLLSSSRLKVTVRRFIPRSLRNWLRSPSRSAEWVWKNIRYAVGSTETVEMRPGWSLTCHPVVYKFAYFAQHTDPDQVAEFNSFISSCRPGMLFFDIGAHFGLFSLAALHFGGAQARAVAIEPSPVATRILRIQAALNHLDSRLSIIEACVGDHGGQKHMVAVGVIGSGYFVAPTMEQFSGELTRTNVVTIDELSANFKALPTHIKLDVEGGEFAALMGARTVLRQFKSPLLFIELHNQMVRDRGGEPESVLELLKNCGYKTFACDGSEMNRESILRRPLVRLMAKRPT